MYSTMKNGSSEGVDKYRTVDVRSDTVSKPTEEMMAAMMEVSHHVIRLTFIHYTFHSSCGKSSSS